MLLAQYYPFKYEMVLFYMLLSMGTNEEIQHLSGGLFEISTCNTTYVYLHYAISYTQIPIFWSSHIKECSKKMSEKENWSWFVYYYKNEKYMHFNTKRKTNIFWRKMNDCVYDIVVIVHTLSYRDIYQSNFLGI